MANDTAHQGTVNATRAPDRDIFDRLMKAARSGDWLYAGELTSAVRTGSLPPGRVEMQEYLRLLKEALVTTKAARASLVMSAVRLHAAASFSASENVPPEVRGGTGKILAMRQNPDILE
jgi:hypothetical protein